MRKSYALEDLDCANCAAKMEAAINKMPQIEKATVSFMTSRLSLVVPDGTDMAVLLNEVQKEISKVEPDCRTLPFPPGALLLLCTDGLSNMLSAGQMHDLCRSSRDAKQICSRLIAAALARGARDNVTALVLFR